MTFNSPTFLLNGASSPSLLLEHLFGVINCKISVTLFYFVYLKKWYFINSIYTPNASCEISPAVFCLVSLTLGSENLPIFFVLAATVDYLYYEGSCFFQ